MKRMTVDQIRDMWLEFFKSKGHYIEPSASLIPDNDPSLLFINAGVAALKKYFDGRMTPPHRRITNAQKSIRTNDIENVGRTDRHHTFFEMLGNFSIGDYFRNEVIPWAYELLTSPEWFDLPVDKLYVTYYPDDKATHDLWVKCGIPADHMIPSKENFWEIGEGPCGPDTEINFDRGEKYDPKHIGVKLLQDDIENDRYIELWNIVFSQYNSKPGLKREDYPELPHKNIDTGASLERFACIMQGTESNFEIDTFKPIIDHLMHLSGQPYEGEYKMAYRVIADHTRCLVFALADGAVFSNEGRGYVLRRILRRADRFAKKLGLPSTTIADLVPYIVKTNDHFYPYLKDKQEKVTRMISAEETRFASTLKRGEAMLNEMIAKPGDTLSAADAFKLSDTYGFPFELTEEICHDAGKKVDEKGFEKLLEEQKEKARKARAAQGIITYGSQHKDLMEFNTPSDFTYDDKIIQGKVIGLFKDGKRVDSLDDEGWVAFDHTNFYAEQGGQIADQGTIENSTTQAEVTDCQHAPNRQNLHKVKILFGTIKEGDVFTLKPDFATRALTRKNHSACHLLHQALADVLNNNTAPIPQEGSVVGPHICRLDFAWDRKLTDDELDLIEENVNARIQAHTPCEVIYMDKAEAMKLPAYHQFANKYGATVRVVKMGNAEEFCGGTHVSNTEDINVFTIVSESAISAGVRRIVAVTGEDAYQYLKSFRKTIGRMSESLDVTPADCEAKVKSIADRISALQHSIKELKNRISESATREVLASLTTINNHPVHLATIDRMDHDQMNTILTDIANREKDAVSILISTSDEGRLNFGVSLGKDVIAQGHRAGDIVKKIAPLFGGNGGGRPNIAFGAGRKNADKDQVLKVIAEILA
ncbi:MAG TPA: alanine--tRNA ligase [Firmicutes bacterium]|nr:alanine--tRNA ligase [Bacillota bacterium]